eukprot:XP_019927785.1 PREDICTED: uncharacterized protein LOC109620241 [Crassostrea gigas]
MRRFTHIVDAGCRVVMEFILLLIIFAGVQTEGNNGNCKEMLQGYLTGQLSSALGAYQVEALRREFISFTDDIEKSMIELKQNVVTKLENIKNTANNSVVYTRWGRKNCPTSAALVLSDLILIDKNRVPSILKQTYIFRSIWKNQP